MDALLQLSGSPLFRSTVKALGLPVPLPPQLKRTGAPWQQRELADDSVAVLLGSLDGGVTDQLAGTLAASGARAHLVLTDGQTPPAAFQAAGEAWGEPCEVSSAPLEKSRYAALIADASGYRRVADLDRLYEFFHLWTRHLAPGGRVIVIGRAERHLPAEAAVNAALDGFTRSLSKELGRRGSTANLLRAAEGCGDALVGPLRFLLSRRSTFITGQPLTVTQTPLTGLPDPVSNARGTLRRKVALVTGAGRGIGRATAEALAREGAHVVVVEHPSAQSAASKVARALGGSVLLQDVAARGSAQELSTALRKLHGGVDIVVQNAGVTRDKTIGRMSREQWDLVLGVNLRAVIESTRELLDQDLIRRGGRLVFLSSVGGIAGNPGQCNYGATKAGLLGLTRSLAQSAVLQHRGITANAIAPGLIETPMTAKMPVTIREAARRLSSLNQGGLPSDVAEAIAFMALPAAQGLNGQTLRVCGGALVGA